MKIRRTTRLGQSGNNPLDRPRLVLSLFGARLERERERDLSAILSRARGTGDSRPAEIRKTTKAPGEMPERGEAERRRRASATTSDRGLVRLPVAAAAVVVGELLYARV